MIACAFILRLEAATVAVNVSPTFFFVVLGFLGRSPTYAVFDISEYCIEGGIWHELIGKWLGPACFPNANLFWSRS